MPCDSIITQSVSLESITSPDLLKTALESIGVRRLQVFTDTQRVSAAFDLNGISYTIAEGKLSARGYRGEDLQAGAVADQVKQAYSKAAIYAAARKHNWLVKEVSKNRFEVSRRF